jgi:hypothetical protein
VLVPSPAIYRLIPFNSVIPLLDCIIIFGLPEEKQEIVCERVQDIFKEIGLKPTLQASRVGKNCQRKG